MLDSEMPKLVLLLILSGSVSAVSAEALQNGPSSQSKYSSSMTVVPPVCVSQHVEVEIRVAVRNHATEPARFELVLSLESEKARRPIIGTPLEVAEHGQELYSLHVPAKGISGESTITYELKGPEGFEKSGHSILHVVECETRAVPLLQVGWMDPGAMIPKAYLQQQAPTESYLRKAIDHYHKLGFAALIITYPESIYSGQGVFYPTRVFPHERRRVAFDVVGTILNQASINGQHVFVGLGRGPDLLLTWTGFDDSERNHAALAHSMKTATELWALYGHEPSFYGWYLTHEANDIAQASRSYYNPLTLFLRTFSADKPVLISPSGTPILNAESLLESEVDIFAYQDAVGSGYVPYRNTFDPQKRIETLKDVYESYARAHQGSGKHLWTNLEIWEMEGPQYGNSYPANFARIQQQLDIEKEHVDVISSYTLSGFMEPPDSTAQLGGAKAVALFKAYADHYQRTAGNLGLVADPTFLLQTTPGGGF